MRDLIRKYKDNVVFSLTRRYMKLNRKRTLITFLGIMLMVTLMTCAFVGKDTALGYMERLGSLKDGSWHVAVYNTDIERLREISELEYVADSAYSADYGFTDFDLTSNSDRPYLFVKAYGEKDFEWMNIYLTEGRYPQNGSEIVISRAALDDGSPVKLGDVISAEYFDRYLECTGANGASITILAYYGIALEYGGEPVKVGQNMCLWDENAPEIGEVQVPTGKTAEYTVVGFIDPPSFEVPNSADYIALTLLEDPEALDSCNMVLKYDRREIKKHPNASWELYDMVASPSDLDFNNFVLSFSGLSSDQGVNTIAVGAVVFFVVLIMLASVLLIYNLFQISLDERSRWLGQLTSIGATSRQKRSSIFYECFLLLIVAVPAGIILGTLLILAGMSLLKPALGLFAHLDNYTDRCPIKLVFSWKAILLIVAMSCITVLISALIPARRVAKIGPMESIRGSDSTKKSAHYSFNEKQAASLSPEAWLAMTGTKREFRRNSSIIRAAAIFMAILVITTFASDLIARVTESVLGYTTQSEHLKDADFVLSSYSEDKTEYQSIKAGIAQEESVESMHEYMKDPMAGVVSIDVMSDEYRSALKDMFVSNVGREPDEDEIARYFTTASMDIIALDNESFRELTETAGGVLSASDAESIPALIVSDGHMSTDGRAFSGVPCNNYKYYEFRHMTDLGVGERFETVAPFTANGMVSYNIEVTGFISGSQLEKYCDRMNPDDLLAIINRDTADRLVGLGIDFYTDCTAECVIRLDGTDPALEERLDDMTGSESMEVSMMSLKYAASLVDAIARIVRILLVCFVLVVSVICLINLGNSIRSRLIERSREFAAMRTIGITDGQLRKQLLLECLGHILFSTLVAAAISALLIAGLYNAVNALVGHLAFNLPVGAMICAVLVSSAAVCVFTLLFFPSKKGASLIEEIRRSSI